MEDLLQHIDLDYYRAARLLIVRAEIAQLRRQASVSPRVEPQGKIPTATPRPADDFNQLLVKLQLFNQVGTK
jgi:hypothetical protein